MSFGPNHYVPVLKVKQNEKAALQRISPALWPRMTPLLEIVVRKADKTLSGHLDTAFKNLRESVQPFPRFFLDVHEMADDGPEAAREAFRRASAEKLTFTPVTGISRTADVDAALENREHGLALRLTRNELEHGYLGRGIVRFLEEHHLAPEEVDLIMDLGPVDELIEEGIAALSTAFLAEVPSHTTWRTFTISASAFPMSMGRFDRHSHAMVERSEWLAWKDHLYAERARMVRLPTFSDCAIQHPRGVEGFDFRTMQVSAAIRYALPEGWLLIKGESTKVTLPSVQFPALATKLVYGPLRTHFMGAGHCDGCAGIKAAADKEPRFGSAGVWRRLGTVHHISMVMEGLASLSWP